jgi:opacity protein-like surface antigen
MRVAIPIPNRLAEAIGRKKMYRAGRAGAMFLLAMCAADAACADDTGAYAGASIGYAEQSAEGFDGNSASLRAFAGYSFSKYLAVEAAYVDVAKQEDDQNSLDIDVKSDGFLVAGLVKLPLTPYIASYAKVGYVFYDTKTTASSGPDSISQSDSDEDLLYGVGFQFDPHEHFSFRFEYEKVDVPDGDFDIVSASALWRF